MDRAGRWHVAFAAIPDPIPAPGNGEAVGIDRGVVVGAALSTGELLHVPGLTASERNRLRRLERKLARAKRRSNRRARVKLAIARLRARETDRRKDWAEKTSTSLAHRFDIIRVEDLRIRNMTRSARGTRQNPGRNVRAKAGLEDLSEALADDARRVRNARADYAAEIPTRMAVWREEAAPRLDSAERPIHMARLCRELNIALPASSILVADGGFAGHWTGLLYDTKSPGRHFIPDRGLASIGYGLPGGIGAALAAPGTPVVAITGDGGFNMTLGELETARRAGIGLTIVVVNNAASGYVKALQHAMMGGRYQSADLNEMDYAAIARTMGCGGIRVEDPEALSPALRQGMEERDRPTVIDVVVTRDPAQMLPAVDNRTVEIKQGDRVA